MINRLQITDFAIIEKVAIDFFPGLTVITGETGSGKSIILEAISTIVNGKTSKSMVKSGSNQSVIELNFNNKMYRKVISKNGRTKSYLNDSTKSIIGLKKDLGYQVEFHGQNDQQLILKSESHIDYLDYYCNNQHLLTEIKDVYDKLEKNKKTLKDLDKNLLMYAEKKELLNFQFNEIELSDLKNNEDTMLHEQYKKLNNQEKLINTFNVVQNALNDYDNGMISKLTHILGEINQLVKYDKSTVDISETINSIILQLQEVGIDIEGRLLEGVFDKSKLPQIEERIGVVEGLKRKYGGSISSVLEYKENIKKELEGFSSISKSNTELKNEIQNLEQAYFEKANLLSKIRSSKTKMLASLIERSLGVLNMPHAKFKINVSNIKDDDSFIKSERVAVRYTSKGIDHVEFLLSANPGEPLKPMAKIASGGEMSRIMLAIKTVFQDKNPVATLIFDEIDTGISGETAKKVSNHLKQLSKHKQIICITHLPQIAMQADNHLHISKSVINSNSTLVKAEYLKGKISSAIIKNLFIGDEVIL
jgi:DNA repair protein RecN (Recombination protein N)